MALSQILKDVDDRVLGASGHLARADHRRDGSWGRERPGRVAAIPAGAQWVEARVGQ